MKLLIYAIFLLILANTDTSKLTGVDMFVFVIAILGAALGYFSKD